MKPTQIAINQVPSKQTTSPLLAEKMACLLNNVRTRAYELFERRGKYDGYDLDDWFRAEADLGVLQPASIEETETGIRIRIERSEFSADQVQVHAEPQAITVEGSAIQTDGTEDSPSRTVTERTLYGRYRLPVQINTGSVTARMEDGVLEIVAGKTESAAEKPSADEVESKPLKIKPLKSQVQKDRSAAAQGRSGTGTYGATVKA